MGTRGNVESPYHVANLGRASCPDEDDVVAAPSLEFVGSRANSGSDLTLICLQIKRARQGEGREKEGRKELHFDDA